VFQQQGMMLDMQKTADCNDLFAADDLQYLTPVLRGLDLVGLKPNP